MNLKDFINYRDACPFCNSKLVLTFRARKQSVKVEDDWVKFRYDLKPLKRGQHLFKVEYCFNMKNNDFYIEFYNSVCEVLETVSLSIIKRFIEFHKHGADLFFGKECRYCKSYFYNSNNLTLVYKEFKVGNLEIYCEDIWFISNNMNKQIGLHNFYLSNKSEVHIINISDPKGDLSFPDLSSSKIEIPLVPFISKEETLKRLENLILFS